MILRLLIPRKPPLSHAVPLNSPTLTDGGVRRANAGNLLARFQPRRVRDTRRCSGLTYRQRRRQPLQRKHTAKALPTAQLTSTAQNPTFRMSSPEQRRSNRSSVNGTPRRSARSSQAPASSPSLPRNGNANAAADEQLRSEASDTNMQDVTPRGNARSSQHTSQSQAPPTSSPLFFRSSPNGSQSQSQSGRQGAGGVGMSSPLKGQAGPASSDGARTPRASGGMAGGMSALIPPMMPILTCYRFVADSLRLQL